MAENIEKEVLDKKNEIFCLTCSSAEVDVNRLLRTYGYKNLEKVSDKVLQEANIR